MFKSKQFMSAYEWKTFRKSYFIETQKSQNVNIKNKVQKIDIKK